MSVNKVILVGNLGHDPEVRTTNNGSKVVQLSIATSERWRDRGSGEQREKTEWHRVVIFNERLADVAERYLQRGRQVYIEGQLQTRKWQDQEGNDKYTTEIVLSQFRGELQMIGGRGEGGGGGGGGDFGGDSNAMLAHVDEQQLKRKRNKVRRTSEEAAAEFPRANTPPRAGPPAAGGAPAS